MKKLFTLALSITMAASLAACSSNVPKDSGMEIFKPGAYRVTVDGHNAPITVLTTFSKDKVTKIEVEEQQESAGVGDTAMQSVADGIIAKQSFEVDIVSGATYSCYALLEAVSIAAAAGAGAPVDIIKMPVHEPEASQPDAPELAEGELLGKGAGIGGELQVKVVMDGDIITAVEVISHNETPGISDPAISEIPDAIVDAQSSDVDSVSGATITSDAIKDAVKDATGR